MSDLTYDHGLADEKFRALVAIDRDEDDLHLDPGDEFPGSRFKRSTIEIWLEPGPQQAIEFADPKTRSEVINTFGERAGGILVDNGISAVSDVPRDREQLVALSGIGEARATEILEALDELSADTEGGG